MCSSLGLTPLPFKCEQMSFPLQSNRGNQSLDLGSLVPLLLPLLQWQGSLDDVLPDIILLAEVVEFPDPAHSFGT